MIWGGIIVNKEYLFVESRIQARSNTNNLRYRDSNSIVRMLCIRILVVEKCRNTPYESECLYGY